MIAAASNARLGGPGLNPLTSSLTYHFSEFLYYTSLDSSLRSLNFSTSLLTATL